MQGLALLPAVAAALPGEERSPVAGLAGRPAGFGEAPVAVLEEGSGQVGEVQVEEREDEQLVPEDVAPVSLAVKASSGNPDVEVDRVLGDRLEQVEHVEAEDPLGSLFGVSIEEEASPQVVPSESVTLQEVVEPLGPVRRLAGGEAALGDGRVPGREEGHDLLHGYGLACRKGEGQLVGHVARFLDQPPLHGVVIPEPGAGGFGDADAGLVGFHQEVDEVVGSAALDRVQVVAAQRLVTGDATVVHPAINGRADLEASRPVHRQEGGLQCRQVRVAHVHETPLGHLRVPPLGVAELQSADQHPAPQVEFLAVVEQIDSGETEPVATFDSERQWQPVGRVHEIFVDDGATGDVRRQPVVHAGDVGAGVVDLVGVRFGGGAPGGEISVAQGAQRLPELLLVGIEAFVGQRPGAHRPERRSRKMRTSPGSASE